MKKALVHVSLLLIAGMIACTSENGKISYGTKEWREYLGGPERNHYSPLDQITKENVSQLKVAWEYHTLDSGQIQCNPLIVDGVLYGMTATTRPFALDAATGKEIWKGKKESSDSYSTSRGVAYWESGDDKRILFTRGAWLYAVDARTGNSIQSFGDSGRTSLRSGLGPTSEGKMVTSNTPGTIFEDIIVMPMRLSEGNDAAPGYIQAFNIKTGKIAWVFKTIPGPGEFGYETWPPNAYKNTDVGAANNWSGMSVDRQRGIIFAPTGSAGFDFYGGNRYGENLFANCLIALDAKTGKRIWHYQFVHHDILDRDCPAPPNLITVTHNGKKIDAVAQTTKQGYVFVFNRETGEPLFPIKEQPMPASDFASERAWPTQPIPEKPAPYARQHLRKEDLNSYSSDKGLLERQLDSSRSEGPFTPLSEKGSIVYPGLDGGAEWGGSASDLDGILYINSNEMAWRIMLDTATADDDDVSRNSGQSLYAIHCSMCHGAARRGNPASGYPSLLNIGGRRTKDFVHNIISNGKGMMPSFPKLDDQQKKALAAFLFGEEKQEPGIAKEPGLKKKARKDSVVSYNISGYSKFLDADGYPAMQPPWGTLNAIDLNTGEYLWTVPYGEYPELQEKKGISQTGSESYGGPVITASGLLLISGTKDQFFRAYDKTNGKLIWKTKLPAANFATPSTYEVNGKQYVVLACGGTKLGAKGGDSYVAYALP
jgi:quinoprotein glucose dehydrogenase